MSHDSLKNKNPCHIKSYCFKTGTYLYVSKTLFVDNAKDGLLNGCFFNIVEKDSEKNDKTP